MINMVKYCKIIIAIMCACMHACDRKGIKIKINDWLSIPTSKV